MWRKEAHNKETRASGLDVTTVTAWRINCHNNARVSTSTSTTSTTRHPNIPILSSNIQYPYTPIPIPHPNPTNPEMSRIQHPAFKIQTRLAVAFPPSRYIFATFPASSPTFPDSALVLGTMSFCSTMNNNWVLRTSTKVVHNYVFYYVFTENLLCLLRLATQNSSTGWGTLPAWVHILHTTYICTIVLGVYCNIARQVSAWFHKASATTIFDARISYK